MGFFGELRYEPWAGSSAMASLRARQSRGLLWALSALGVVAIALLSLTLGEETLTWAGVHDPESPQSVIFYSLRLPRVVLAALVGMALSTSGATLQAMTRNPLADPFVLGVSGGAALGATLALAFGWAALPVGAAAVSLSALAGALLATAVVLVMGRLAGRDVGNATLLAGVIFNAFALAAITFIKALVAPDKLGEVLFWLAGTLGAESWSTLGLLGVTVGLAVLLMVLSAPRLNLLSLGEDDAQVLGLSVRSTRLGLLLVTSLAVSASVAVAGLIGFVGLVVPHLVRLVSGPDQRLALPLSALGGAAFLMLADLGARVLFQAFHTEPPVGVLTSMIGGPAFLLLLVRARGHRPEAL